MSIRDVVLNAVAIVVWEKEQAQATNAERKEHYQGLFNAMRSTEASEGDLVNAAHLIGVELKAKGWKDASIKVRRSEFRRIWENIQHVPDECGSWKKALSHIKEATTGAKKLLEEKIAAIQKQQKDLAEKLETLEAELAALSGEQEEIRFSDEETKDEEISRLIRAA